MNSLYGGAERCRDVVALIRHVERMKMTLAVDSLSGIQHGIRLFEEYTVLCGCERGGLM